MRQAILLAASGAFCFAFISFDGHAQRRPDATREGKCTVAWLHEREQRPLAERYNRRSADAFGRSCLGITARVPINWTEIESYLSDAITATAALSSTVPADIALFCPDYRRASADQRAGFWRKLAYETIKPEAGTNAHALMWEQPLMNGQPAGGYYSIGLLQLSFHDARPNGCDFHNERSVLDPRRNIACGVKIMTKLVTRDGRIGGDGLHARSGLGAYWSTIRVPNKKPAGAGQRDTRAPIIAATRTLPQCTI